METPEKAERVNHPGWYNSNPSGIEAIAVIEHMSFNLGNAVKYLWRADRKGEQATDLAKAIWYVRREQERLGFIPQEIKVPDTVAQLREEMERVKREGFRDTATANPQGMSDADIRLAQPKAGSTKGQVDPQVTVDDFVAGTPLAGEPVLEDLPEHWQKEVIYLRRTLEKERRELTNAQQGYEAVKERAEKAEDQLKAHSERSNELVGQRTKLELYYNEAKGKVEQLEEEKAQTQVAMANTYKELGAQIRDLKKENDELFGSFAGSKKANELLSKEAAAEIKKCKAEVADLMKGKALLRDTITRLRQDYDDLSNRVKSF